MTAVGTDLVALHGLNNTPEVWDGARAHLTKAGEATVRWHCPLLPALDSVEAIAQWLLPQLPPTFALAGFSFGGYVAAALLEAAPERIERVALVCSSTRADNDVQRTNRERAVAVLQADGAAGHRRLAAAQAPLTMHPSRLEDPVLVALRERMLAGYGPERLSAQLRACMQRPDRTASLNAFSGPILLLAAQDDQVVTPELMQGVAREAPRARYEVVPDAGHLMPIERPDWLARALADWLAR